MRIKYIDISYLMKKNVSSSVTTNLNLLVKHFIKHHNEPTTSVHSLEHMQFSLSMSQQNTSILDLFLLLFEQMWDTKTHSLFHTVSVHISDLSSLFVKSISQFLHYYWDNIVPLTSAKCLILRTSFRT